MIIGKKLQKSNGFCLRLPLRSGRKKVSGPRRQSVSRPEERGLHRRRRVSDNGWVYGTAVVGRRGWQRQGTSLLSGWPCWRSGGDAVVRNRKPARADGASCSVGGGGGGGGEKREVGRKIVREVKWREVIKEEVDETTPHWYALKYCAPLMFARFVWTLLSFCAREFPAKSETREPGTVTTIRHPKNPEAEVSTRDRNPTKKY